MLAKALNWIQELPLLKKLIGAVVALLLLASLAWWKWNFLAALGVLGIGLLMGLALVGLNLLLKSRARRRGADFGSALVGDIKKAKAEIGDQFERAIRELKTSGIDVYQLPWYFYVGEPQSGKSFTIRSSGLNFPVGTEGLSGAGGTRNCDFWFTNEAVILDTAGRLLIQSDEVVDREQWAQVLRFLSRYRPNCPINGVLLGIPCTSLLEEDSRVREEKAEIIRKRLKELQDALNVRFPIFLVLLKTDLVLGFDSFFKRLPVLERKQLFGWSNEVRFDQPFDPARFDQAFEQIYQALCRWRLKFLNDESLPENADQFYVFPEEFRALRAPITDYLNKIFIKGPYGQPGFFRGFYFTSSLQEGRAIPHAIQTILGGIDDLLKQPVGDLKEIQARSSPFFIRDLYARKIFSEKGLILRTDRSRLVNAVLRGAALWGGGGLIALGLLLLVLGYFQLGRVLQTPLDLVVKIQDGSEEKKPLEIDKALAEEIHALKRTERSIFSRAYNIFFPSPVGDASLIQELQNVHGHDFRLRHLEPFFDRVLETLKSRPDGGMTWKEFKARSETLKGLSRIGAGDRAKEGFQAAVNFFEQRSSRGPGGSPKDPFREEQYGEDLVREYQNFLEFDAQPVPEERQDAYWKRIGEAADFLHGYLKGVLTLRLDAERADASDPQNWWNLLLVRSQAVASTYQDLCAITPQGIALPATYDEAFRKPWIEKFKAYDEAWKALEAHVKAAGKEELLDQRQAAQRDDLLAHYDGLIAALGGAANTGGLRSRIEEQKREIVAGQEEMKGAMTGKLTEFAQLIVPPAAAKDAQGNPAPVEPGVKLGALGQDIHGKLARLDRIVQPPQTVDLAEKQKFETFPADLEAFFTNSMDGVFAINKEAGMYGLILPQDAPKGGLFDPERFQAFFQTSFAASLTDAIRTELIQHLDMARDPQNPGGPQPVDGWFASKSEDIAITNTLFESPPEPRYGAKCYAALKSHFNALKTDFLEKRAKENFLLLDRDRGDYAARIDTIFTGYQNRFIQHWKSAIEKVRLIPENPPSSTWADFRRNLVAGFGHSNFTKLIDNFRNTVKYSREAVTAYVNSPELAKEHPWAGGMEFYLKEENINSIFEGMTAFSIFVEKTLTDDPVKSLADVRAQSQTWLNGFPKLIRDQKNPPDGILRNEMFSDKLLQFSEKALDLLLDSCLARFRQDWGDFGKGSSSLMAGKFPFLGDRAPYACEVMRGFKDQQVTRADLLTLLGPNGRITKLWTDYKPCLAAKEAPDPEDVGLRIGQERRQFFESCEQLQDLLFQNVSDHNFNFRTLEYTLVLPSQDPEIAALAPADDRSQSIYNHYGFFRFTVNEGLTGGNPAIDHRWNPPETSMSGKWSFGADPRGNVSHAVFERGSPRIETLAAEGSFPQHQFGPQDLPEDQQCQLVATRTIYLKFEARGPWSLLLFLKAYGEPRPEKSPAAGAPAPQLQRWYIRYQYPRIQSGGAEFTPVVFFGIDIDKRLGSLPDWSQATLAPLPQKAR